MSTLYNQDGTQPTTAEEVTAACKQTHPDFTITCDQCGSQNVYVDNDMGWSAESGGWGGIRLVCCGCGAETALYGT